MTHLLFLQTEVFTKRPTFFFIVLTKWPPIFLLSSLKDPFFLFSLSPKDPYFGGRVRTSPSLPYVSAPPGLTPSNSYASVPPGGVLELFLWVHGRAWYPLTHIDLPPGSKNGCPGKRFFQIFAKKSGPISMGPLLPQKGLIFQEQSLWNGTHFKDFPDENGTHV